MDSDELIGQGHTPQWVREQQARMDRGRMSPPGQRASEDLPPDQMIGCVTVPVPLTELGMYGQSLDGQHGWCLCSLCQRPVGGPGVSYTRAEATQDLIEHLRIAHGTA